MKLDLLRLCQAPCKWEHKCLLFLLVEKIFLYTLDFEADVFYHILRTSGNEGTFNWKLYFAIKKKIDSHEKMYRIYFKKYRF
jgi:hypothetical protein